MFERFSDGPRRTLFYARQQMGELGGASIGPEHVLLGLLTVCDEPVRSLFARTPVSSEAIGASVTARMTGGPKVASSMEVPFTESARRVLQFALDEADQQRQADIGNEHLLVGLLLETPSLATEVLAAHGLRLEAVRADLAALAAGSPSVPPPPSPPPAPGDEPA